MSGQAHGLCFSVKPDVEIPPSLVNIYQELHDDLGCYIPNNGYLEKWAETGSAAAEHGAYCTGSSGQFPSAGTAGNSLQMPPSGYLNEQDRPIVFIALGQTCTDEEIYAEQSETSDFGSSASKPSVCLQRFFWHADTFSKTNEFLIKNGLEPIDWQIENKQQEQGA